MSRQAIRIGLWRAGLFVGMAAWGANGYAAGPGSADGKSQTSVGVQESSYGFTASGDAPVMTPDAAFIDLGEGWTPLGFSPDGCLSLHSGEGLGGVPGRWRVGTVTPLEVPAVMYRYPTPDGSNLRSAFSPEFGQGGVSRGGLLAAAASAQRINDFHYGRDTENFVVIWPATSDLPVAIRGLEQVLGNDDDPNQINHTSSARLICVDRGGGVWVYLDNTLVPTLFVGGSTIGDPSPLGPYSPQNTKSIEVYDANSLHQAVGLAALDYSHIGYYVGTPARMVDFVPLAINDAGQVVGDDCGSDTPYFVWPVLNADTYGLGAIQTAPGNHVLAPFVLTGGQRYPLQGVEGHGAIRVSGFDEAGNVYGSIDALFDPWADQLIDRGQDVIWVADPATWGLPKDTPRYAAVALPSPALPAGFEPLGGVLPGRRRVELGLARKSETDGSSARHGFMLVPAQLRVDFNRDGVIETSDKPGAPDREFVEKRLPYCFWVNDDDDSGETGGDDIPGQPADRADAGNDRVDGTRDLVDFFPVYLDIKELVALLPPSAGMTYRLSQADGALNGLCTNGTPATAGNYLRIASTALGLATTSVAAISASGTELNADFIEAIGTGDKGLILLEARAPTCQPVALDVWRGAQKVATLTLPLNIGAVEAMYRRENLTWAGRVAIEEGAESRSAAANLPDELCSDRWFVFVHGYNVNQQQARGWQSEFFKRLWWSGSRAKFVGVTWYGYESQTKFGFSPDYHANVVHAFETAKPFADFLRRLAAISGSVDVAAHSLGNMVVSSAISDHDAPVRDYFMIDGAVAAEAFDATEAQPPSRNSSMPHSEWTIERGGEYPPMLWASEWYDRFPSGDAHRALTWRDRFRDRNGAEYYDFYSTGDEVLEEQSGGTPSLGTVLFNELGRAVWNHLFGGDKPNGRYAWAYQEKLKGRTPTDHVLGSTFGGWGFNNFDFRKLPGTSPGSGPSLIPDDLSPQDAANASIFTNEMLRVMPFFDPGAKDHRLESWPSPTQFMADPLGQLYGNSGAAVASRHRNRLLAQMIPAMSLAAGRKGIESFTPPESANHSFDLNGMKVVWPVERQRSDETRDRWMHSDLLDVAFLYTRGLYEKIVELGGLRQ